MPHSSAQLPAMSYACIQDLASTWFGGGLLHGAASIRCHERRKARQHSSNGTDLSKLRPGLFWDPDINTIDWQGQKRAVIERMIERGSEEEKAEIRRIYGDQAFNRIAAALKLEHA